MLSETRMGANKLQKALESARKAVLQYNMDLVAEAKADGSCMENTEKLLVGNAYRWKWYKTACFDELPKVFKAWKRKWGSTVEQHLTKIGDKQSMPESGADLKTTQDKETLFIFTGVARVGKKITALEAQYRDAMSHLPAIPIIPAAAQVLQNATLAADALQQVLKVYAKIHTMHCEESQCLDVSQNKYLSKEHLVDTMKQAKDVHAHAHYELRMCLLLGDNPSLKNDEQKRKKVQDDVITKRRALNEASRTLQNALVENLSLLHLFPELVLEIRQSLPHEVVELWRPDLTFDAFEDPIPLARSNHEVWKAYMNDKPYALKQYVLASETGLKELMREAAILQRVRHPAIMEVLSIFQDTTRKETVMFLQMPFFENGTLDMWIKNKSPEWHEVRLVLLDVARALEHLHFYPVIHCDVKPSNVLVSKQNRGCLADFDISLNASMRTSTAKRRLTTSVRYTAGYDAPELSR
jgi:uncharacterized protein (DUF2267 family)